MDDGLPEYPPLREKLIALMQEHDMKLGPTGERPLPRVSEDDDGEVMIAVVGLEGKVFMAFGKHVSWLGWEPGQAREIAQMLLQVAYDQDGIPVSAGFFEEKKT